MGTMTDIRETNRAATVALLGELGYDPDCVMDRRGDAALDWDEDEGAFVLEVVGKGEDGKRVLERTDDGLAEYRRALWSPT